MLPLSSNLEHFVQGLRTKRPLVLCLTNHVSMDFVANTLLAIGARPMMSEAIEEFQDLIDYCDCLYINIGTLSDSWVHQVDIALQHASRNACPVVLDPVGVGASHYRFDVVKRWLAQVHVLKGNATEIMALNQDFCNLLSGVDTQHSSLEACFSADDLARKIQAAIVVTGEKDYLSDGQESYWVDVGDSMMTQVTGMGCALGAALAASVSMANSQVSMLSLCLKMLHYFGLSGQEARCHSLGPGSFRQAFLDILASPSHLFVES